MPFITIQSSNRITGTDDQFIIQSEVQLRTYKYLKLKQFLFYNSLYNVTDGSTQSPRNNQFSVSYGSDADTLTTYVLTIPMGYYNWTSMKTALESAASTAISTDALEFNLSPLTNKLSVVATDSTKYLRIDPLLPNQGLNLMLGFSRFTPTAITQGSVTAPRTLNISRYLNLYIISNIVNARSYSSALRNISPIVGCVPVDAPFGSLVNYDDKGTFPINVSGTIGELSFRIVDDLGYPVDFNGQQLTFTFDVQ